MEETKGGTRNIHTVLVPTVSKGDRGRYGEVTEETERPSSSYRLRLKI